MVAMLRAFDGQSCGALEDGPVALGIVARIVQRALWAQAELEYLTCIALLADREEAPTPPPAARAPVERLVQQSFGHPKGIRSLQAEGVRECVRAFAGSNAKGHS